MSRRAARRQKAVQRAAKKQAPRSAPRNARHTHYAFRTDRRIDYRTGEMHQVEICDCGAVRMPAVDRRWEG